MKTKRKWTLIQVEEVDPQGDTGKSTDYDTARIKKSPATRIKARALNELNDPAIVVALGGGNQYVHSTEAYFRQGLSTAIKRMNLHLEALVKEQQQKMQDLIALIDAEWNTKLTNAFGPDTFKSFAEFKKFWDGQLVHNPNPNDFMRKMQHLVELKKIKTLIGAMEHKKRQIEQTLTSGGRSQSDLEKMRGALQPFGVEIDIKHRTDKAVFEYGGTATTWKKMMQETTQKVVDQVFDKNSGLFFSISKAVDKTFNDFKNGITSKIEIDHAAIGSLFEALSAGVYKDILRNPKTDQVLDMQITRVAAEIVNSQEGKNNKNKNKNYNNHKFKADSKIELLADGEVILEFLTSDKTGQSIDWTQASNEKSVNLKTRTIDQFTATIESKTLNFSNFEIDNVESFNANKDEIQKLINYVIANGFAFAGRVSIVQFKELLVLYAAWLKIIMEIVGDVDISEMPLAIRTLQGLYSTADVLRLFVNITPQQMHTYLNNSMFKSFYKSDTKLSNRLKNMLFASKKNALAYHQHNISYEILKTDKYSDGIVPDVATMLGRINTAVSQNWPAMQGSYLIKLNNLKAKH